MRVRKLSVPKGAARRNVARGVQSIRERSQLLDRLVQEGRIAIVGAMYDVTSRDMDLLDVPTGDRAHSENDTLAEARRA
jgi:carbonic anhydrase